MNRLSPKRTWRRRLEIKTSKSARARRARSPWRRPGSLLEVLEERTVLSTLAFPTSGNLQYTAAPSTTSALTVSTNGTDYTFTDADQTITLDATAVTAGWTGSGTNTVTGPNSSVSTIAITTNTGNDTITIQSTDANTTVDGGSGTNTLNVTSGVSTLDFATPGVLSFGAGQPTIDYTNIQTINITKPASPPAGSGTTITAAPGQSLNNAVVASFTETDLGNTTGDFTASIDWGDSTTSAGTIVPNGSNSYNIQGSHTYAAAGIYQVRVTLTDLGSTGSTTVSGTTINVTSTGPVNSTPNPIVSTANVAASPLIAQGATVAGREGIALNPAPGGDVLVATFMDTGVPGTPADYSASIDWGDGTTTAATRITSQGTPNGVVFSVFGNHTYAEAGTDAITVTITRPASGATAIASGHAVIADAPLTAGAPVALSTTSGELLSNTVVGTFTDANTAATAGDFTASIDWGDGTATSLGTPVAGSTAGTFNIEGTHAYAKAGTYATRIVVDDVDGSKVTLTGTVAVTDAALTGTASNVSAVEGLNTGPIVLATITDPNTLATAADLTATVDWGDGTGTFTVPVTLVGGTSSGTIFQVTGSHTYAEEGKDTIKVTVTTTGGATTTTSPLTAIATVADAPITASGASITGLEGNSTGNVIIATFSDANPGATVADFTTGGGSVVVDWGDGSAPQTLPASNITASGSPNGVLFTVRAAHTYAEEGHDQLTVTITDAGGSQAVASGSATIADAPLTGVTPAPTVTVPEGVLFSGNVAVFNDLNPNGTVSEFRAMIDWGDGSPETVGTITQSGGPGTAFLVSGSHTYADSLPVGAKGSGIPGPQNGTYPITIYVTDAGGSQLNLTNTATVTDVALTVTGKLNPASDSGASNSDNITDVVQPNFLGTVNQPDATVSLYAQASGSATPVLIGQGTADSTGSWSITSNQALADGSYTITAIAVDSSGHTISNTTTIVPNLVIDTVGPKVTNVIFNRFHAQIQVTFQDFGGPANAGVGLNLATVIDANNYSLTLVHHPRLGAFRVNAISVTPSTTTGAQTATLAINGGHYLRGGWYFFTIHSVSPTDLTGVQDIAGNALDGEFYGYFPSGNNHPGGDFVAQLTAIHHTIFPPSTVIGRATPVSPPGVRGQTIVVPTTFNPSKLPRHAVVGVRAKSDRRITAHGVRHASATDRHQGQRPAQPISTSTTPRAASTARDHHPIGTLDLLDTALDRLKLDTTRRSRSGGHAGTRSNIELPFDLVWITDRWIRQDGLTM